MHVCLVTCTSCGIQFAVPREFFDARVADQRSFTCPSACKVQLGVASSTDRQVRSLGAKVDELHRENVELVAALMEAREILREQVAEIALLTGAVAHYELVAATTRGAP